MLILVAFMAASVARMDDRFDRREARFDCIEETMDKMQRFYVATTVGSIAALTAIFSPVANFLS